MRKTLRFAVISDLHYRKDNEGKQYRPEAGIQGVHFDPVAGLLKHLKEHRDELAAGEGSLADFLLCPGDICDRADGEAFVEGWSQLKALQEVLGAQHLIASTGNHEIHSRASREDQTPGNAEVAVDPLETVQKNPEYPSKLLTQEQRWIYWGRGYEIIEHENLFVLLINSSHFHPTMQPNEYERGRIGVVALEELRQSLKQRVSVNLDRIFLVLLHHHPVPHQSLDVSLGRIDMHNGELLMHVLEECGVAWIVIHGHKHFPRLIFSATTGQGQSIVLAAASAGAELQGEAAARTRLQFYIVEMDILSQKLEPTARGRVRALSWLDRAWQCNTLRNHGLPDRCGFQVPSESVGNLVAEITKHLASVNGYVTWSELTEALAPLRSLLPERVQGLRRALESSKVKFTWPEDQYFPADLSL